MPLAALPPSRRNLAHAVIWPIPFAMDPRLSRHLHTLILILGLVSALYGDEPAGTVLFSGQPAAGLLTRADHVEVTDSWTTIVRAIPYGEQEKDFYLLPVPPGELDLELRALTLRNMRSGELLDAFGESFATEHPGALIAAKSRLSVSELGILRRVRVAKVVVDHQRPIDLGGQSHEIASYEVRLNHAPAAERNQTGDMNFRHGIYERILEGVLLDSSAIDRFALEEVPAVGSGPTQWQPLAAESPGMPWLRFSTTETGFHAIDGQFFSGSGVDMAAINPGDIRIVCGGKTVPVLIVGPEDGGFARGQRVLFYASGSDSAETAEQVFFVGSRPPDIPATTISVAAMPDEAGTELTHYRRSYRTEKEELFQTEMGAFLSVQRMLWVWKEITAADPVEVGFDAPGIIASGSDGVSTATLRLYSPKKYFQAGFELEVLSGRRSLFTSALSASSTELEFAIPDRLLKQGGNTIRIVLRNASGKPDAEMKAPELYLDSIDLVYTSQFSARNGALRIGFDAAPPPPEGAAELRATGFRVPRLLAFDVSDPASPARLAVTPEGAVAHVHASLHTGSRLLLVEDDLVPRVPAGSVVREPLWQLSAHSADVLIIHHALFSEAAELLAGNLRAVGYEVAVADVQSVYDSFSHGAVSTEAIRSFLAHSVYTWTGRRPAAAILIGDANGDGRNVSRQDLPNFIPIHSLGANGDPRGARISSESFYSWLSGGDELADIVVARISSAQPDEALATVRNIIEYRKAQDQPSEWSDRVLAIADTGMFRKSTEKALSSVSHPLRDAITLAADDFAWEDNYYLPAHLITREEDSKVSPLMTAAIERAYDDGVALSMFFGHGAPNLWSNQRFWFGGGTPNSDILRLTNEGRLPLVTSFTCNNAVVDYPLKPWNICIAEDFMRHEGKGAIGCFMPSGPGYLTNHEVLAEGFLRSWLELGVREHGALAELSRLFHQVTMGVDDHSRMFLFLGDPLLRLPPAMPHGEVGMAPAATRPPIGPVIREVYQLDAPTTATLTARWGMAVENISREKVVAELVSSLLGDEDTVIESHRAPLALEPGAKDLRIVEFRLPGPGVYRVRSEIPNASGEYYRQGMPTSLREDRLVLPGGGDVRILRSSIGLRDGVLGRDNPRLEMQVANLTTAPASFEATVNVQRGDEMIHSYVSRAMGVLPGSVFSASELLPTPLQVVEPHRIEVLLRSTEPGQEGKELDRCERVILPSELPDFVLRPESIRVSPETLSDGLTVFVDGEIENGGGSISPVTTLGLYAEDEETFEKPLRNITSSQAHEVGPLKPGERRPFRLRWDPTSNAGTYSIVVAVDPRGVVVESNKENNSAKVPIRVRTKMKLVSGNISWTESAGEMVLTAQVLNMGETDAGQVMVNFYASPEQKEEGKIGEVLVPRVPAGQTVDAVLVWDYGTREITRETFHPSFTMALKGSLMRVSSVAEK